MNLQRLRRSRGKEFEQQFESALSRTPYWWRRMRDGRNENPFDYLVLSDHINVAIECKRIQSATFRFSSLKAHQIQGLIRFDRALKQRNISIVAINHNPSPLVSDLYLVSIHNIATAIRNDLISMHIREAMLGAVKVPGKHPDEWDLTACWPFNGPWWDET